jgi:hypothetical protein
MTAPGSVKIVLEGERAEAATRDLFSKGWFEAEWERRSDDGAPDSIPGSVPPSSVVSAQVVAIAGGSVTIADKILGWWQGWSTGDANAAAAVPLSVVLETPAGARVPLAGADRDSLVEVLRVLHTPGR